MSRGQRRGAVWVVAVWLALAGCSGHPAVEVVAVASRQWPPDDPRIELEQIVADRPSRRGFWRRLAGASAPELLRRPYSVAWDGGDLLVTDPGAGRVVRIDPRGRASATPPDLVAGPIGVAVCDAGIVVTDSERGRVLLLSEELRLIRRLVEGLERPTGVACQGSTVFVAETGRHRVLALTLEPSANVEAPTSVGSRGDGLGELNFPTALALDRGKLWIGDTLNFRVQQYAIGPKEFDSVFGALGDSPGEMPRIKGLAVDRAGQIWISDGQTDRVALYGSDGTFLMSLGATGSADGEFSFPAGIATHPDGRVAVVDSLNRRVAIFRLLPRDSDDRIE